MLSFLACLFIVVATVGRMRFVALEDSVVGLAVVIQQHYHHSNFQSILLLRHQSVVLDSNYLHKIYLFLFKQSVRVGVNVDLVYGWWVGQSVRFLSS